MHRENKLGKCNQTHILVLWVCLCFTECEINPCRHLRVAQRARFWILRKHPMEGDAGEQINDRFMSLIESRMQWTKICAMIFMSKRTDRDSFNRIDCIHNIHQGDFLG